MKRKIFAGLIVLFFLFSLFTVSGNLQTTLCKTSDATCTWVEKTHYSGYDFSSTLVIDPVNPKIIYAGMETKLYKSQNYGTTWAAITNGLPSTFQSEAIAIDKQNHNVVYVTGGGTSGEGLYKSTDGGASWHKKIGDTFYGHQIAIDPKNHNIVYVTAENGRVYKTTDGGAHWTHKDLGSYFRGVAVCPVHTNIIYAGGKGGLYKSTDSGNTWSKIVSLSDHQTVDKVMVDPKDEKFVYMMAYNFNVHKMFFYLSSNAGIGSWILIDQNVYDFSDFDIDPKNPSTIYGADWQKGVFKSTDRGAHWSLISSSVPYGPQIIRVDPVHPTVLYAKMYESGPQNSHIYRYVCPVASPAEFDAHFSENNVYFSWQYPSNADIDYFEIKYKQAGSSTYHLFATNISKTKHSFTKSNFTATNTTFYFVISAFREAEHSSWAQDSAHHQMKPSITGLTTYSHTLDFSKLKLTWNKASIDAHADYIKIFKSNPDCSGWLCLPILVKKISMGTTDFNNGYTYVDGLKFDKNYTISLITYDEGSGIGADTSFDSKSIFIPDIPKNFEAYANGDKIYFSWGYDTAAASHIDNFRVFMLSPHLSTLGTLANTKRTLTINASYTGKGTFLIASYKGSGFTNSAYDSAYVLNKPDAPGISNEDGHIKVKWDKTAIDPNANKIEVYKSTNGNSFVFLEAVHKDLEEFTDSSVSPNVTYYYALKARRETPNEHADISVYSVTTQIKISPPAPPSSLTAEATFCSEVHLSWIDNSSDEGHFILERKKSGGSYSIVATLDPDTTEYTDSTVEEDTTYYYRVKASNDTGDSGYSNEVSVSVPKCENAPLAPTDLTASAISTNEIDLSWTDNSDNEDGFKVERKTENGTYSLIATLGADTTTHKDTTCSENTKYYYRVRSFNEKGNSSYSNEASATTLNGETVPEAPTSLSGEVRENGSVVLKWTDNSDNEDGFKVERKEAGGTYSVIGNLQADEVTYTDFGAQRGKVYWYRVRAFNSEGYSFYSNEASFTIPKESGEEKKIVIVLWPDNPIMSVNGTKQEIDQGRGTKPVIIPKWSRTVVPIRAIVEALGGTISWNGTERKVTIQFKSTIIELWIDNPKAKVNGTGEWIDNGNHNVKPIIINDRTMLPLRFVAENLGCEVGWDEATREIKITYPKP